MYKSKAEIIAKIREHFSKPDSVMAWDSDGICVYRGTSDEESDGMLIRDPHSPVRCAFGVLIPDELYKPEMEGKTASDVCENFPEVAALFPKEWTRTGGFLEECQRKHDDLFAYYPGHGANPKQVFLDRLEKLQSSVEKASF